MLFWDEGDKHSMTSIVMPSYCMIALLSVIFLSGVSSDNAGREICYTMRINESMTRDSSESACDSPAITSLRLTHNETSVTMSARHNVSICTSYFHCDLLEVTVSLVDRENSSFGFQRPFTRNQSAIVDYKPIFIVRHGYTSPYPFSPSFKQDLVVGWKPGLISVTNLTVSRHIDIPHFKHDLTQDELKIEMWLNLSSPNRFMSYHAKTAEEQLLFLAASHEPTTDTPPKKGTAVIVLYTMLTLLVIVLLVLVLFVSRHYCYGPNANSSSKRGRAFGTIDSETTRSSS